MVLAGVDSYAARGRQGRRERRTPFPSQALSATVERTVVIFETARLRTSRKEPNFNEPCLRQLPCAAPDRFAYFCSSATPRPLLLTRSASADRWRRRAVGSGRSRSRRGRGFRTRPGRRTFAPSGGSRCPRRCTWRTVRENRRHRGAGKHPNRIASAARARRRAAAQHQFGFAIAKNGELVRRRRGKRIAVETERAAIPLDRSANIRHAQNRDCLFDIHSSLGDMPMPNLG